MTVECADLNAIIAEKVFGLEIVENVNCCLVNEYWEIDPDQEAPGELKAVLYDGNKDEALEAVPDQHIIKGYPILCLRIIPNYIRSVTHDYQVLKHIRENWDIEQIDKFLIRVLKSNIYRKRDQHKQSCYVLINYEPGDYSIAALEVLGYD